MQLIAGGYPFDDSEVSLNIHSQARFSPRGTRMTRVETWDVTGWKTGDDAADLTSKLTALQAAINDGADLTLYDNNGSPTAHSLSSSGSLNGVQVIMPVSYPPGNPGVWGMGTEYVQKRTYRIRFQAEYLDSSGDLVFYTSSYTNVGSGGPKNVWCESLTGIPIVQTTRQYTKCLAIQQGRAIGLTSYPAIDNPLFGDPYIQNERSMVSRDSPQRICVNASLMWPVRWRYVFESASPL